MALPQQLKSARYTNSLTVSSIDNSFGEVESAIADILGVPVDTTINSPISGHTRYAQVNDSAAVANTVTQTAFNKTFTIPGNSLAVGDLIKIRAFGKYSAVSNPGLSLRIRIGGTVMYGMTPSGIPNGTDIPWFIEAMGVVRAIGAGGTVAVTIWGGAIYTTGAGVPTILSLSVDTTGGRVVDLTAEWSVASPSNTVTMQGLIVEILGAGSTS